jgi:hypothetical protein
VISVSSAVFQTFRVTSDRISDSTRVTARNEFSLARRSLGEGGNDEKSRKAKTMKGK